MPGTLSHDLSLLCFCHKQQRTLAVHQTPDIPQGSQHRLYEQHMAPGSVQVVKSQIWPLRAARIHLCQDSLQDIDVLQPIPCKMGREDRPKGKSRLSRSSSVSAPSIDPPVSTPRSLITSRSGALFGVIACVTIALSIPQLYPPLVLETQQSGSLGKYSNDTITTSTLTPQRRCNKTIEDAVEAAVMGAFLADAASLGLHGSVCNPLRPDQSLMPVLLPASHFGKTVL